MELHNRLVLNRYFLDQLGYGNFDELRTSMRNIQEGYASDGRSYFVNVLIGREGRKILEDDIFRYDKAIKEYADRLVRNRREPVTLKYFQYLTALFSEIFLDRYFNRRREFLADLNGFVNKLNRQITSGEEQLPYFEERDLRKLAYWMATGSGKTLIMHINYWQYLKYASGKEKLDNIILITPNEGLSRQHFNEMRKSGIPCRVYGAGSDSLNLNRDEVLIIDIHKLTEEKKGEGVRVEVDYFEGRNLVFIDEGHKGQATEEKTWKRLRERIGRTGFIFEYSATFGQVISERDTELLEEYSKAIIFDYSYKYFYTDGYGKDFYVYNLSERSFQEKFRDLILTANLLTFYEQMLLYERHKDELRDYQIEKPLWAFVGSKVSGAGINSDILTIVRFLKKIIDDRALLKRNIEKILDGSSGLKDPYGNDIFAERFVYLRRNGYTIDDIYEKVFNAKAGSLNLFEIKTAEGEIGMRIGEGDYFGVINIGDVAGFKKLLANEGIEVKPDSITPSLFDKINASNSSVNILIGAKKFIEGWDSWRVSSMGLINMGRGEGPQIIQLFGRGVRLKGRNYSLKRSNVNGNKYHIKALETLNIFGLNADYVNIFLETIKREGVDYEELSLPIKLMDEEKWRGLYILKSPNDFEFRSPLRLRIDGEVLKRVKLDIRPKIVLAHGLSLDKAKTIEEKVSLEPKYLDLLNWDEIYLEVLNYKIACGYSNLLIDKEILQEIIKSNGYSLYALKEQVTPRSFRELPRLKEIVLIILKSYLDRFYNHALQQEESNLLRLEQLDKDHENLSFNDRKYILRIPKEKDLESEINKVKELLKQVDKLYREDREEIPTICFDRHLYVPLAVYGKDCIESNPPKLNKGETEFIMKLRDYLKSNRKAFMDTEIFVLRNLSRRGVKFFQTSGFYPDFILWVRKGDKQTIAFIDPKGIRMMGAAVLYEEKVKLHGYIKDIERKLGNPNVKFESFILSVSKYEDIKESCGNIKKEEFEKHHILFMEDGDLIEKLLQKLL
jgi:hypothetical protein